MIFVAGGLLIVAATAGATYWAVAGTQTDGAPGAESSAPPPAVVNLDPFVVNLADPGGARFLRITIALMVRGEEQASELAEDPVARMRVRSSILEMLTQQTAARLTSMEGKTELKKAIAARASESAEHLKVADVLFSEFIVQ